MWTNSGIEMESSKKKTLLSGIQPSGTMMIGNYLGAIRNWVARLDEYDCLFPLVDLHAITVRQDPATLRNRCLEFVALYIACGIDPERSIIFVQSHVSAHAQLAWILNCFTYTGELSRMTQFKEKRSAHAQNVNVGLFDYPVLMAADILLYGTDLVPVGADQKQHLELIRDIAERFNNAFGPVFTIPEPYLPNVGARIMSLQEPRKKMSKSDSNPASYVALLDPPDLIRKKIRSAVTDSETSIAFDEQRKPGISNLLTIYAVLTGRPPEDIAVEFDGKGYAVFKDAVADIVIEWLVPIRRRFEEVVRDKNFLSSVLSRSAADANARAGEVIRRVHDALGFVPQEA